MFERWKPSLYLILTSNIPNCEADVFVLHCLHIEPLKYIHKLQQSSQNQWSKAGSFLKVIDNEQEPYHGGLKPHHK
jgi:hypothetical protein